MRHLQLGPLTCNNSPVLAPVELEGFAGRKDQRHEGAPAGGLQLTLPFSLPAADECRHTSIGTVITQRNKISVQLLCRALLFARLAGLLPQPPRQLLGKRVQLAWPVGKFELRLHCVRPQIFTDRVPRQSRSPLNLSDRDLLPKMPATNYAQ
jgi:hypothetical protein